MLSVGVFNGYYPYTLKESVKRIKTDGFTCVQLDLCFKDMDTSLKSLDKTKCRLIRDAFRDENLLVVAITADVNLVHPDPVVRKRNINKIKTLIKYSHDLGCSYVVSEVGTFYPDHDWTFHPRNVTEEGYTEALEIIRDLVKYAYDYGAVYLLEVFNNHVINSIETLQRLFADINHKSIGLLMDPTNYYDLNTIKDPDILLNKMFDAVGDKIKVAHAKDCKIADSVEEKHADIDGDEGHSFRGVGGIELPAPGLGVLNYARYVERLYRIDPNIPLIIEHVDDGDMQRAKKFVDNILKETGC